MPTRKLDKAEWRPFLDGISKLPEAKEVEIESLHFPLATRSKPNGYLYTALPTTRRTTWSRSRSKGWIT